MKIQSPDYSHSIVSLTNSILKYFGAETLHETLPELDDVLKDKPKRVILLLFDGLGVSQLERHLPENSFLRSHLVCPISSVFPPTTVAATASVICGLNPVEHGRLGWWLYFSEVDDNVSAFGNLLQKTNKPAADYRFTDRYLPYDPVWKKIRRSSPETKTAYVSPFGEYKTRSAAHACRTVLRLARNEDSFFSYCYRPLPDSLIHAFGTESRRVRLNIRMIDYLVRVLCSRLKDSVVIVTADHGLTDVQYLHFSDYPELNEMLLRKPSLEGRAVSIFVKDGMQERFKSRFEELLGEDFILLTKEQVYEQKLFGPGEPHPRTDGFIGDFLAVATGDKFLTALDGRTLKAHHAGMTAEEMNVPLIICRT